MKHGKAGYGGKKSMKKKKKKMTMKKKYWQKLLVGCGVAKNIMEL